MWGCDQTGHCLLWRELTFAVLPIPRLCKFDWFTVLLLEKMNSNRFVRTFGWLGLFRMWFVVNHGNFSSSVSLCKFDKSGQKSKDLAYINDISLKFVVVVVVVVVTGRSQSSSFVN
jgi:hypothetical protein